MKKSLSKKRKTMKTIEAFGVCYCNCSCSSCSCYCPNEELFYTYDYVPGYGVNENNGTSFELNNTYYYG